MVDRLDPPRGEQIYLVNVAITTLHHQESLFWHYVSGTDPNGPVKHAASPRSALIHEHKYSHLHLTSIKLTLTREEQVGVKRTHSHLLAHMHQSNTRTGL